ncbi:Voltage-dependent anion-selective channel [Orchesella cincta]|uniref:Voltage-dependent anion-selective channel n=1 Tax=Orchesella cincta TaxID=48709 RepID=A0A1D2N8N7_ORCCI|nr:Voltage-dependent anion-selective channel [Orchesella cincta]
MDTATLNISLKSTALMCHNCETDKCPDGSIGDLKPCPASGPVECMYEVGGVMKMEKRNHSCSILANISSLLSKEDNEGEIYRSCQDCNKLDWDFPGATKCPSFTKLFTGFYGCICDEDKCNNITLSTHSPRYFSSRSTMSYPTYNDFGKSNRDFFTKGFQTGSFKLNLRNQVTKHIGMTSTGSHKIDNQQASGDIQAKCTCPFIPGFVSTAKWTTGNLLTYEVLAKDKIYRGVDMALEGQYSIDTSTLSGRLKSIFKHDRATVDAIVEMEQLQPEVGAAFVTGYQDFAAGYTCSYDTAERVLKKNNISMAYVTGPLSFHASLDNAEIIWAGLVFKFNKQLEAGITTTYKSDPEGYSVFGAAIKYVVDCCTAIKAKVDTDRQISLGFEVKIRPTSTITMSTQLDGNKLDEGGHKIGLSFDLEC